MLLEVINYKIIFDFLKIKFKHSIYEKYLYQSTKPILFEEELNEIIKQIKNNKINELFIIIIKNKYINLILKNEQYINFQQILDNNFNQTINKIYLNKKIIIDCFGINFGKPIHFGHLRSGIYGSIVYRLLKIFYKKVHTDAHFGDFGINLAIYINYFIKNKDLLKTTDINKLIEIYKNSRNQFYEENTEITKYLKLFEEKDIFCLHVHSKLKEITLNYIKNIIDLFNIELTYLFGESDYIDVCRSIEKNYKDFIIKDNNRLLIKYNNTILTRSDNTILYSFTDLATIKIRKNQNYNLIIYCVDNRQSFHFKKIFEASEHMFENCPKLLHLPFGFVKNNNNKIFKTRSDDNIFDIEQFLQNQFLEFSIDKKTIAESMIFYDIGHKSSNEYIFDLNTIKTNIIRYKNIKNKIKNIIEKDNEVIEIDEYEISLANKLIQTNEVIFQATQKLEPHYLYLHLNKIYTKIENIKNNQKISKNLKKLLILNLNKINKIIFNYKIEEK